MTRSSIEIAIKKVIRNQYIMLCTLKNYKENGILGYIS